MSTIRVSVNNDIECVVGWKFEAISSSHSCHIETRRTSCWYTTSTICCSLHGTWQISSDLCDVEIETHHRKNHHLCEWYQSSFSFETFLGTIFNQKCRSQQRTTSKFTISYCASTWTFSSFHLTNTRYSCFLSLSLSLHRFLFVALFVLKVF